MAPRQRWRYAARMSSFKINRVPFLTLWASVVAKRLGFDRDEALSLGRAVAGLAARAKGVRIGIIEPTPKEIAEKRKKLEHREQLIVALLGRAVPVVKDAREYSRARQGQTRFTCKRATVSILEIWRAP
jgi:hypothetical protein